MSSHLVHPPKREAPQPRPARWAGLLVLAILILAGLLYYHQAFLSYMDDDEGGYAYAAWRISLGEMPYRDFLTPQLPVFLYWGGLLVRLFGRSFVPLRIGTMLAMLASGYLLYRANRELFGPALALLSLPLYLVQYNIYHDARLYRPEAYMLLFVCAGLYATVRAERRDRAGTLALASVLFALSMLCKLFGSLPWAACWLYLAYACWRERRPWRWLLRRTLYLVIPGLVLLGATVVLFSWQAPYFFTAVFGHHLMQGAGMGWGERLSKTLAFYGQAASGQYLALLVAAVGGFFLWRQHKTAFTWPIWQFPTLLGFAVLTRNLYARHTSYLAPALSTLLAAGILGLWHAPWWRRLWRRWLQDARRPQWLPAGLLSLAALALCLACVWPWLRQDYGESELRDSDTQRLAALIAQQTSPDELVVMDYLGVLFLAGRQTTYWGAGLSEGATQSGQITAAKLISDMEQANVGMVVIHARQGTFHLAEMPDYYALRTYVHGHFALVDHFARAWEIMEIYDRDDWIPIQPAIDYQGELLLSGARIPDATVAAGSELQVGLRWQAQRKMARDYYLHLALVDAEGRVWAEYNDALVEKLSRTYVRDNTPYYRFYTSDWDPPRTVWQDLAVPLPDGMPPGTYDLVARVDEPYSGLTLHASANAAASQGEPIIASIQVVLPETPPAADEVDVPMQVTGQARPGLQVLGSNRLPASIQAGHTLDVELWWYAPQQPGADYTATLRLLSHGQVVQQWPVSVAPDLPSSQWRAGECAIGRYRLALDRDLPAGNYLLDVVGDGPEGSSVALTNLEISAYVDPQTLIDQISHPVEGVTFSDHIELLGYDLSTEALQPGEWVRLTLYWRCLAPPAQDYVVFTHLLDDQMQVQGQRDAVPGGGSAPTASWQAGDVIVDPYDIQLKAEASPGELAIEIGFYDPFSSERLPLWRDGAPSGDDHLILPSTLTVR